MKNVLLAIGTLCALGAAACSSSSGGNAGPTDSGADHTQADGSSSSGGDSSGGPMDSGGSSSGGDASDGGGNAPTPPALGTQIDRMGRPAINTALNHTFDTNATTKGAAKDAYNADKSQAGWPAAYLGQFKANLAIYDGLDTTCGNQAGYGALTNPDYTTLASVLANDVLWVNTANSTCKQYLGVEFAALGVSNSDCGGRTPSENVIDLTFNAVAGTLTPATLPDNPGPVTNGIKSPASPPSATFPYLATPH
jgi:hypothetical protein